MQRNHGGRAVIIGAGRVGSHCALGLITDNTVDEVVLIDQNNAFAVSQAIDLADYSTGIWSDVTVRAGSYQDCDRADVILVTAGRGRRPGETRLQLLNDTLVVLDDIATKIHETSFNGVVVCITNPVDIATEYLTRKLDLAPGQVFGTGTALDTIRLERVLARETGVDRSQVRGLVMGEHGDSSFVAWSHVTVGGANIHELRDANITDLFAADREKILHEVHTTGSDIISGKGCTEFGIAILVSNIVRAIMNRNALMTPLSMHLDGQYGEKDISTGVPCVIDKWGRAHVLEMELTEHETELMRASCEVLRAHMVGVL